MDKTQKMEDILSPFVQSVIDKVIEKTGLKKDTINSFLDPKHPNYNYFVRLVSEKVQSLYRYGRLDIISEPGRPLFKKHFLELVNKISLQVLKERTENLTIKVKPILELSKLVRSKEITLCIQEMISHQDESWDNDERIGSSKNTFDEKEFLKMLDSYDNGLLEADIELVHPDYEHQMSNNEYLEKNFLSIGLYPAPVQYLVGLSKLTDLYFPLATAHESGRFKYTEYVEGKDRIVLKTEVKFEDYKEKKEKEVLFRFDFDDNIFKFVGGGYTDQYPRYELKPWFVFLRKNE